VAEAEIEKATTRLTCDKSSDILTFNIRCTRPDQGRQCPGWAREPRCPQLIAGRIPSEHKRTITRNPDGFHPGLRAWGALFFGPQRATEVTMITENVRSHSAGVRLSESERRYLEGVAREDGTTLSEVIRRAVVREARRTLQAIEQGKSDADDK